MSASTRPCASASQALLNHFRGRRGSRDVLLERGALLDADLLAGEILYAVNRAGLGHQQGLAACVIGNAEVDDSIAFARVRHRRGDKIHVATDQHGNSSRRGHLDQLDRHANSRANLANEIDVEARGLVFVVEEAEGRCVELHTGKELAALLDLDDGSLRRLRGGRDRRGDDCDHGRECGKKAKCAHRVTPWSASAGLRLCFKLQFPPA